MRRVWNHFRHLEVFLKAIACFTTANNSTHLPKSSLLSPHEGQLPSSGAGYTAAAITHPDRWKNSEICNRGRTLGNTIFTSANFKWGESSSTGFSRCEEKTGKPGDPGEDGLSR